MSRTQPSPADWALWLEVSQFLHGYADHLDHERFADWVALFDADDCRYEVLSRENRDLGLNLPIMGCFSHGMCKTGWPCWPRACSPTGATACCAR